VYALVQVAVNLLMELQVNNRRSPIVQGFNMISPGCSDSPSKRIVFKVGGAALFHPVGFQKQLLRRLEEFPNDQILLVAGGGDLVESMRSLHKIYPTMSTETMHWRCIDLLGYSLDICNELMPLNGAVHSNADFHELLSVAPKSGTHWIRVTSFYSLELISSIPEEWRPSSDWNTTTDVIAWLLAKLVSADTLVLMKQCSIDPEWSLAEAAGRGVVDAEIARLASLNNTAVLQISIRQG